MVLPFLVLPRASSLSATALLKVGQVDRHSCDITLDSLWSNGTDLGLWAPTPRGETDWRMLYASNWVWTSVSKIQTSTCLPKLATLLYRQCVMYAGNMSRQKVNYQKNCAKLAPTSRVQLGMEVDCVLQAGQLSWALEWCVRCMLHADFTETQKSPLGSQHSYLWQLG